MRFFRILTGVLLLVASLPIGLIGASVLLVFGENGGTGLGLSYLGIALVCAVGGFCLLVWTPEDRESTE